MEQKPKLFIYDRREMIVLILLGAMVALFAFTLGVHLGKKVGFKTVLTAPVDTSTVPTVSDQLPNRQEFREQGKDAQQAADETLSRSLHEEVTRTGVKLDTPHQVDLPKEARAHNGGATTLQNGKSRASETAPEKTSKDHATKGAAPAPAPAPEAAPDAAAAPDAEASAKSAPQTSPTDTSESPKSAEASAGKFTLQIGSFTAIEDARIRSKEAAGFGLQPFIKAADLGAKGTWYRVYVGGFASRDRAEKAGESYRSQHKIDSFIVAKISER